MPSNVGPPGGKAQMKVVWIDLPQEEVDKLVAALHGLVEGIAKALETFLKMPPEV